MIQWSTEATCQSNYTPNFHKKDSNTAVYRLLTKAETSITLEFNLGRKFWQNNYY